jgi:hypothetical protein
MAGYNTRQSTYTDGDVIDAAHSNNEFDAILAAFVNTTGHAHDGTAGEGPVIGLIGDAGLATPLNKVVVDTTNDRLGFFIDVSGTTTEQIRLQDGALLPVTDNDIDLGSSTLEFKDLYIDGTAYLDAINFNGTAISATAAELNIMDGVTASTAELNIMDGVTATTSELNILDGVTATFTELNLLDGVTASTSELNIVDGSTAATSTTVADADRVVLNDNGTMVQAAVTDLDTYFSGTTKTLTNKTLTTPVISSISNTGTLTLPTSTDTLVGRATTDTLTNKTLTSAVLNGTISGTSIKDEDDMTSDSASHLATQQSIKAYVDSQVAGKDALSELSGDSDDITEGTTNLFFTNERVDDRVDSLLTAGSNITLTYDDTANTLTIAATDTDTGILNVVEDTTPQLGGVLDTNGNNIEFGDSTGAEVERLKFGAGDDISMYWDGTDGHLEVAGTLNIDGSGETLAKFVDDGAVELYYNNVKKIETTGGGISVTGDITVSGTVDGKNVSALMSDLIDDTTPQLGGNLDAAGRTIDFADNGTAIFGTGDDMKIFHDGTNSYITENGTGDLYIGSSSGVHFYKFLSSEKIISGIPDGAVELFYDAVKKFETTSTGATVTGELSATSIASATTATTQTSGTNNTTIATTAFATTVAQDEATALAIALG